jgi:hypothetical protein
MLKIFVLIVTFGDSWEDVEGGNVMGLFETETACDIVGHNWMNHQKMSYACVTGPTFNKMRLNALKRGVSQ